MTARDDVTAAIELSLSEGGAVVDLVGGTAEGNALYSRCTTVRDEPGDCTRYTGSVDGQEWCVVLHRE